MPVKGYTTLTKPVNSTPEQPPERLSASGSSEPAVKRLSASGSSSPEPEVVAQRLSTTTPADIQESPEVAVPAESKESPENSITQSPTDVSVEPVMPVSEKAQQAPELVQSTTKQSQDQIELIPKVIAVVVAEAATKSQLPLKQIHSKL